MATNRTMDMPTIAAGHYTNTAYNLDTTGGGLVNITTTDNSGLWGGGGGGTIPDYDDDTMTGIRRHVFGAVRAQRAVNQVIKEAEAEMAHLRVVRVFIVDPDERIEDVNKRLLHEGDEQLTDLTDQELFFEVDIKKKLEVHNDMRVGIVDPNIKDRTEYLKPVKIRDLKMVVVNVATF